MGCVTFAYGAVSEGAGEFNFGANPIRVVWVKSETMPQESERLGGKGVPSWAPEMGGAHEHVVMGWTPPCWCSRSWRGRSVAWGRFVGDLMSDEISGLFEALSQKATRMMIYHLGGGVDGGHFVPLWVGAEGGIPCSRGLCRAWD